MRSPSGDQAGYSSRLPFVSRTCCEPSGRIRQMSSPPRSEEKAIHFPSGDQAGDQSLVGLRDTFVRWAPSASIT
jgi:hypothetical protein